MKLSMLRHSYPGKLIVFCGVDGAGKTTLLDLSEEYLRKRGVLTYRTRMPSAQLRQLDVFRGFVDDAAPNIVDNVSPFALTVLVTGDRLIVQEMEVIPKLRSGVWVLVDRYAFSGLACSMDPAVISLASRFLRPDLAILADATPEEVKRRVKLRPHEADRPYSDSDVRLKQTRFRQIAMENDFFRVVDTQQPQNVTNATIFTELQHLLNNSIGEEPAPISDNSCV